MTRLAARRAGWEARRAFLLGGAPNLQQESEWGQRISPAAGAGAGKPGGLIAPAGPLLELDDLTRGEELCRALGFEPVLGPNARRHYGYLAGTDEQRLADLNAAIADPKVDAVWCLRGGYGMTRILDQVDFAPAPEAPQGRSSGSPTSPRSSLPRRWRRDSSPFTGRWRGRRSPRSAARTSDRVLTTTTPAGRLGRVAPPADVLVPQRRPHRHAGARHGRRSAGRRQPDAAAVPPRDPVLSPTSTAPSSSSRTWARVSTAWTGCWPTSADRGAPEAGRRHRRAVHRTRSAAPTTARSASTRCWRPTSRRSRCRWRTASPSATSTTSGPFRSA